jgi:hypothetical protein
LELRGRPEPDPGPRIWLRLPWWCVSYVLHRAVYTY